MKCPHCGVENADETLTCISCGQLLNDTAAQPEEPAPAAPADPVDETVSDIDESVQRLLARAMDDVAAEKARGEAPDGGDDQEDTIPLPDVTASQPAQDGDEDDAPVSRIDFGSLQFGRDYEIK